MSVTQRASSISGERRRSRSIRAQILTGYFWVALIIVILVASSLIFLFVTEKEYEDVESYRDQQCAAQEVITAHYQWLEALNTSISTGASFTGGLDPDNCSLGKWLNSTNPQALNDGQMSAALQDLSQPHKDIHTSASSLVQLSQTDREAALAQYSAEIRPKVEKIGDNLSVISGRYQAIATERSQNVQALNMLSIVMFIALGALAIFFSFLLGGRVSKKISAPIIQVEQWSVELSTGVENLTAGENALEKANGILEIELMIQAFQAMAQAIRNNVEVIKRVADGDLTAFVDIRSDGDSLGNNLYHLVQNNDMMFADLLRVADSVAQSAEGIADANQTLAQKAVEQAQSVEGLSSTVNRANDLAQENVRRAEAAAGLSEEIKTEIYEGENKMTSLVRSVDEIKIASDKIASVMKVIDEIAFQTNILALNASVEAARAGESGKGFSVVAQEVRNLALRSAEAAKQSGTYIENTIAKTAEGSRISQETFETFKSIVRSSGGITDVVKEIAEASAGQQKCIGEIHEEIQKISGIVSENASTSQETAAATEQMNSSAELIWQAMKKFNLRKREAGRPYIPAEKANDPDFVRQATENYRRRIQE